MNEKLDLEYNALREVNPLNVSAGKPLTGLLFMLLVIVGTK